MTYCVAAAVNEGLVFVSDSRTNAGIDRVSVYPKCHRWSWAGDRAIVILSAGSLATTQMVVKQIDTDLKESVPGDLDTPVSLKSFSRMADVAEYVGRNNAIMQKKQAKIAQGVDLSCTLIVGGQIGNEDPELYLVYPEGNFIAYSASQPFIQAGETKYGKPILDRIVGPETTLEDTTRCLLVSMASTLRSNASVGFPIDVVVYPRDSFSLEKTLQHGEDDSFFADLSQAWSQGLVQAFEMLPRFNWESPQPLMQPTTNSKPAMQAQQQQAAPQAQNVSQQNVQNPAQQPIVGQPPHSQQNQASAVHEPSANMMSAGPLVGSNQYNSGYAPINTPPTSNQPGNSVPTLNQVSAILR